MSSVRRPFLSGTRKCPPNPYFGLFDILPINRPFYPSSWVFLEKFLGSTLAENFLHQVFYSLKDHGHFRRPRHRRFPRFGALRRFSDCGLSRRRFVRGLSCADPWEFLADFCGDVSMRGRSSISIVTFPLILGFCGVFWSFFRPSFSVAFSGQQRSNLSFSQPTVGGIGSLRTFFSIYASRGTQPHFSSIFLGLFIGEYMMIRIPVEVYNLTSNPWRLIVV